MAHGASKATHAALVAAALLLLTHFAVAWWPRTVDDAFITFRYAANLVQGHGPVFNPGERVEGYSNPSWMLLAAGAIALGLDPVIVAKCAGLLAAAALLVLLDRALVRSGAAGAAAGLATLLLGSSYVLGIWSVSGMESTAFALLLFAGLAVGSRTPASASSTLAASSLLAAAALTRPEGLALWIAGAAIALAPSAASRARRVGAYALPGIVLALHVAWRLAYYGDLLPNTYYAKTGGGLRMWAQGLDGLTSFAAEPGHLVWLAAAAAGLVAGLRRPATRSAAAIFALAVVALALYVASVGDDGLFVHRFYVPLLAPLAWLAAQLLPRAEAAARPAAVAGACALVLAAGVGVFTFETRVRGAVYTEYLEGNVKLGRHLATTREPDTLIAVAAAGAIPFYSRLPALDMYGLNDRTIARGPFPPGAPGRLMKWDVPHVLSRRPDLIVINRGYFAAGDPGDPSRLVAAPLDRELAERVRRDGSYRPRVIDFPDGSRFFVFERLTGATTGSR